MANVCILCGASPTTKAHVFASRLRLLFPKELQSFTRFQLEDERTHSVVETRRHGRGTADWKPKVLCARCNGEWMSPIEERAAATLVSLARGESLTLATQQLRHVAEWALAASIVRAETFSPDVSFDRDVAVRFREAGLEASPVRVWMVKIRPEPTVPASLRRMGGGSPWSQLSHDYLRPTDGSSGEACMFQMLSVALIVATGDVARHVCHRLRFVASAAATAWPAPADPIQWPPRGEASLSATQALFSRSSLAADGFFDLRNAPGQAASAPYRRMVVRGAQVVDESAGSV